MKNIFTLLITICAFSFVSAQLTIQAPNGDVGIGTDTPLAKLDVRGSIILNNPNGSVSSISGAADNRRIVVSNNTNTLNSRAFFEMFGSNPVSRAGEFVFGGTYQRFLTNVTNTSFGIESMRLTDTGRLGIGIASPASLLHVNGDIMNAGGTITSDKRLKKDIKKYKDGLDELLRIEPYTYYYNGEAGIKTKSLQVGIMAQDFEKIAPYAVSEYTYEDRDQENKLKSSNEYKCANTDVIMYMLVNSVKEQQKHIEELEKKIETMSEMLENSNTNTTVSTQATISEGNNYLGQGYPNPSDGVFSVDYVVNHKASNAKIEIFDISGRLIKSVKLDNNTGTIDINIQGLAKGIYNYSLIINDKISSTKKVILN